MVPALADPVTQRQAFVAGARELAPLGGDGASLAVGGVVSNGRRGSAWRARESVSGEDGAAAESEHSSGRNY